MYKRVLPILFLALLLTGCGKSYYKEDYKPYVRKDTFGSKEPKFELSQYQTAVLVNARRKKMVLTSKTGESLTLNAPNFYTYEKDMDVNTTAKDYHITMVPPGDYYDDKGQLVHDYVTVSVEFVDYTDLPEYDTNTWRVAASNLMLDEESFDGKKYATYTDYANEFTSTVDALFPATADSGSLLELTGELSPIKGSRCIDSILIDEETYELPIASYRFELDSGNYVFFRYALQSTYTEVGFEPGEVFERLIQGKASKRDKKSLIDYLTEVDADFDTMAKEMFEGFIIGDYSTYFEGMDKVVELPTESVSGDSVTEFKTEEPAKEEKKPVKEEPDPATAEDAGYMDYNVGSEEVYFED